MAAVSNLDIEQQEERERGYKRLAGGGWVVENPKAPVLIHKGEQIRYLERSIRCIAKVGPDGEYTIWRAMVRYEKEPVRVWGTSRGGGIPKAWTNMEPAPGAATPGAGSGFKVVTTDSITDEDEPMQVIERMSDRELDEQDIYNNGEG